MRQTRVSVIDRSSKRPVFSNLDFKGERLLLPRAGSVSALPSAHSPAIHNPQTNEYACAGSRKRQERVPFEALLFNREPPGPRGRIEPLETPSAPIRPHCPKAQKVFQETMPMGSLKFP